MAFLDGIFGKPASSAAPAAPAPATATPAAPTTQQQVAPAPASAPVLSASKLDEFNALFAPRQQAGDKPPSIEDPLLAPIDPAAFKAQVANANFASAVPAEVLQKAAGGDPAALLEAINLASREAFAAATTLSHGLAGHAAREAAQRLNSGLDGRMREVLIRGQNTENPVLTKPSVAPVYAAIKQQVAASFPDLSPAQVNQRAEQYFLAMAEDISAPSRQAQSEQQKPAKHNFASFLS